MRTRYTAFSGGGNAKMADIELLISDLEFGRKLGSGGTGTVYKGRWKSRNMTVAIKTLTREIPARELEIMRLVDHPNLTRFYGAVNLQPPTFCIVAEYAEKGSLFDFLHQSKFDPFRNHMWAIHIAAGMKYLHFDITDLVVIHGDLKSNNVLIDANNTAKICDFGSSKVREQLPGMSVLTNTKIFGTPRWMAPEILENKPVSKQCDVYSYGIVVWELLTHKIPFEDISDPFQIHRMVVESKMRPPLPATCVPVLANLLKRCWNPNPQFRPVFIEILSAMELLPQMLVGEQSATKQLQSIPHIARPQVEKRRPIPLPRNPRRPQSVFQPGSPQDKKPKPAPRQRSKTIQSPPSGPEAKVLTDETCGRKKGNSAYEGVEVRQPNWAISRDEVELLDEELGKGAWGVVRKARFRGNIVAAKCLHEALRQERSEFLYKAFRREMDIAANLRHPNLVLFLGATTEGELIILSELMDSNLRAVLNQGWLSRFQIKSISFDVTRALNYLHSMKPHPVIHRDVTSANVLLERFGPDNWRAKVSDYGSLRAINVARTVAPGNPVYAAPEAMQPGPQSCKMDTYSLGVLLIEMCTSEFPIPEEQARLLRRIKWPEMRQLIERCIQANPADRPAMLDILSALEQLSQKTGAQKNICTHIQQHTSSYIEMRWFVPLMSRTEAEKVLEAEGKEGNFVVRHSSRSTPAIAYSLSVYCKGKVYHYRIRQKQSQEYCIEVDNFHGQLQFQTMEELIEFYKKSKGGLVAKLCEYPPTGTSVESVICLSSDEIPRSELTLGSEIARGQCGYVVAGQWKGFDVAVRVTRQEAMDEAGLRFIGDAVNILRKFQHENLLKLHGVCTKDGWILILTELMTKGPLDKYLLQSQMLLENKGVLLDMATQICSAMKFLEEHQIVHGDLAARNCLVGERNVVKVADYSLALYTSPRKPSRTVVSIRWAAPELFTRFPTFTIKSDVWSFGIVLWEMWSGGQTPYNDLSNQELKMKLPTGYRLEKPGNCPDDMYGLMHKCWEQMSEQRPTFASLNEMLKLAEAFNRTFGEHDKAPLAQPESELTISSNLHEEKEVMYHEVKLCLLGESGAGKTCLIKRFVSHIFSENVAVTVGTDFASKTITVGENVVSLQIWDTAGQERFRGLAPLYYRDCAAAIVVYDITDERSFNQMKTWISELRRKGPENVVLAIAGNKVDLADERKVPRSAGERFAKDHNAIFMEISTKDDINVQKLFRTIAEHLPLDEIAVANNKIDTLKLQRSTQLQKRQEKCNC